MTVYSAFTIPTLGMMGHSYALSTIGNNIANVTTGGFKRTDTNFSTLLSRTIDNQSDIGGIKPKDLNQIIQQGNLVTSTRDLDLAINGHGFYIFNSSIDGSGETYYGRDGSFEMATVNDISVTGIGGSTVTTKDGYLVDKNGYFLQGWTADPATGLFSSTSLSALRIDPYAFASSGQTTTNSTLALNLPSTDSPGTSYVTEVALSGTVEAGDKYSITVDSTTVTYTVSAADATINDVRNGLIAAVNADPTISALATASASPTSDKILVTGKTQGVDLTISSSTPFDGGTIDTQALSTTVQEATNGDRQYYNIQVFDSNGNARSVRLDLTKTDTNTWNLSTTVGVTPVAQVDTVTLAGTIEAGDIYSIVVDGTTFSQTAIATDNLGTIRDALIASINADTSVKVTAAAGGPGALTLTADTAGTTFSATSTSTNRTPVAQVETVTIGAGTSEAGDVFTTTVAGNTYPYTSVGPETETTIANGLAALINADPNVSATNVAGVITITANVAGTAFASASTVVTDFDAGGDALSPTAAVTQANIAAVADNTATLVNTTANVPATNTTTTSVTNLTFNPDGSLATPAAGTVSLALSFPPTESLAAATATVTMDISGLTQFAGDFLPVSYTNNGYAAANAQSIRFDSSGQVIAGFDNSTFRPVYKIPLAQFANANALQEFNGNVYQETEQSGSANVVDADKTGYASFLPNTHELSNVDLAGEFTRMMMTQTAYNSSATVFKTVDEMLTAARDLKR